MPTNPHRAKKALQQTAKVFNKLASGLNADLNEAVRKIEKLRREVQNIKTTLGRVSGPTSTPHRKNTRTGRIPKPTTTSRSTGHTDRPKTGHETAKLSRETSEYVFPREPFNTPAPPEQPSPSGNN